MGFFLGIWARGARGRHNQKIVQAPLLFEAGVRVCVCPLFRCFSGTAGTTRFFCRKAWRKFPVAWPRLAAKQDITFDDKCFYFLLLEQLVATVALRAGLVPVFVKVAKLACDRCICLAAVRFLFYHQHLLTGAFYDLYPKSIQVGFVRGQLASGRGNCLRTGAGLHKDAVRLC